MISNLTTIKFLLKIKIKLGDAEEKIRENLKNKAVEGFSGEKISDEKDKKFEETKDGEKIISKSEEDVKKEYREELKSSFGLKRYKIQEVIKPGQVILIQVIKEEEAKKVRL